MLRKVYLYESGKWNNELDVSLNSKNTLVICYGSSNFSNIENGFKEIVNKFPNSIIVGNSTSGEIYQDELYENSLSVAIIKFEKTQIKLSAVSVDSTDASFDTGKEISKQLQSPDLKSIFILSDGLNVNGSQLTKGINSSISDDVVVTGGLAGDDARFEQTWVIANNKPTSKIVTAIGFYGENINVAHGSQGGWSKFGIDRVVTSSKANVLYELDNKPALEVYKTYLGESAKDLPSSGLLYPLMIEENNTLNETKVRTILAVDEEEQSITFAGDIPTGSKAMFMKASFSELIDGASDAASKVTLQNHKDQQAINIAISCVGRKLVLGQKTEDEIEAVFEGFNDSVAQIGYYSYGEISPLTSGLCDLHNQTMTLTLIWES